MLVLAGLMVLFVILLILPAGLFASLCRYHEMTCGEVFVNMDGNFEFVFWYTYADNNWVKIYDMAGKEVFKIDMPYDNPHFVASVPNGMYAKDIYSRQNRSNSNISNWKGCKYTTSRWWYSLNI